jgi:hypothetical protein
MILWGRPTLQVRKKLGMKIMIREFDIILSDLKMKIILIKQDWPNHLPFANIFGYISSFSLTFV